MRHAKRQSAFRRFRSQPSRVLMALAVTLLLVLGSIAGCSPAAKEEWSCPYPECGGKCFDLANDPFNCGGCGIQCQTGSACSNSQCQCQAGLTACGASCANTLGDGNNCGSCGTVCPAGLVCGASVCGTTCPQGETACGNSCANLNADAANCGGCGIACTGGTQCQAGTCACPPGVTCNSNGTGGGSGVGGNAGVGGTGGVGTGGDGTGTGGDGTGGTGGDAPVGCTPGVDCGGYIQNGTWKGYAFTGTWGAATVMPADYETSFAFPLCARGTVPKHGEGANGAMFGWSVNQDSADGAEPMPVTPTAGMEGITVRVTNSAGSDLRLVIQAPKAGSTDQYDSWCATLPPSGGFVPYSTFNTECWTGGMGQAYAGQPFTQALVQVPANADADVSYDFCVDDLFESVDTTGPVGTTCALGPASTGGTTITGQQTRLATREGRNYIIQNNVWTGTATQQSLRVNGMTFEVIAQNNPSAGSTPVSFPSVFIGNNFGRNPSGDNLPKQVSALTEVPTAWRWSGGGDGDFNAAYDVWFSTTAAGDPEGPSGGYLMVWYRRPGNRSPLGSEIPNQTFTVGGRQWKVWTCGGCWLGKPAISYIPASGQIQEYTFDLNDFIKHAQTSAVGSIVKPNWYLTNIFAGFEIWSGGVGPKSEDFCAIVR